MEILSKQYGLAAFWEFLKSAEQALLLLDFDGTLAPFVVDPHTARPYPGVVALLKKIEQTAQTRLVIVSGRDVDNLERCLGMSPAPQLWGCHGWQRRMPGEPTAQQALPQATETLLRRAEQLAKEAGYSLNLEHKPVSLALHWRGLNQDKVAQMRATLGADWQKLTLAGDLQLHDFDGGIELRCSGVDKGTVVSRLLKEVAADTVIAYLGDDLTDEDAFVALADRGLKVLVRQQYRTTAADLWLQPPEELRWFLQQWIDIRRGTGGQSV